MVKAGSKGGETSRERLAMTIQRLHAGPRMSQAVIHGDTVYLAGQVGAPGESVTVQTKAVLASIESLLAEAGSDKSKILSATIWMADMADFGEMNAVWDAWVAGKDAPARATGEARLATPDYKVEIIVVAAR
jgi:enamine deaminase RidA (YjgF/YER057c/UK114 family)